MRAVIRASIATKVATRFAATAAAPIGQKDSSATTAKALDIPEATLLKGNPVDLTWANIDVAGRARLAALVASAAAAPKGFGWATLRYDIAAGKAKAKAVSGPFAKAAAGAQSLHGVVEVFEACMVPVRESLVRRDALQLEIHHLNDQLNLGLAVSSPKELEAAKVRRVKAGEEIDAENKKRQAYADATFTTAACNDLVNALRMASEGGLTECQTLAISVMEDMTLCGVAFDEASKLLLKSVVFGDAPHDDSSLLFTHVENPERGEISIAKLSDDGCLKDVVGDALKVIAKRHTTPLTDGVCLQQVDTHPNLQRSAE